MFQLKKTIMPRTDL